MTKHHLLILPALLLSSAPALAGENAKAQPGPGFGEGSAAPALLKTSFGGDVTSFTNGKGSRRLLGGELTRDFGSTSLSIGATEGRRDFGKGKKVISGTRFSAGLVHDWGGAVSTATSVAFSSGGPVFERVRIAQDVDLALGGGTVLRVGGRFSRYRGGMEVGAGSAGIAHYFGAGLVSYRLSAFDVRGRGRSFAHLVSVKVKDPAGKGSTQLWAGTGSSLHDHEWVPDIQKGRLSSLTLKRTQPLAKHVGVSLSVGRSWYDRPLGKYQGTKFGIGLAYSR